MLPNNIELCDEVTVLANTTAFMLNVSLWTARKKIAPEDFGLENAALPPEELATLGSKRICPPERLRVFGTLRSRAVTLLSKYGVRFLGGWLIPSGYLKEVRDELAGMKRQFDQAKKAFLSDYSHIIDDWISGHAQWEHELRNAIESPEYVDKQLHFGWSSFKINIRGAEGEFKTEVQALGNTLFDEIASAADSIWKDTFQGKETVTHRALSPLNSLAAKMAGLAFVEPRIAPAMTLVMTAVSKVPQKGNITGAELASLQGIVLLMRDKDALIEHSQRVLDGKSPDLVLAGITPPSMPAEDDVPDEPEEEIPVQSEIRIIPMPSPGTNCVFADSYGLW